MGCLRDEDQAKIKLRVEAIEFFGKPLLELPEVLSDCEENIGERTGLKNRRRSRYVSERISVKAVNHRTHRVRL